MTMSAVKQQHVYLSLMSEPASSGTADKLFSLTSDISIPPVVSTVNGRVLISEN